MNPPLRWRTLKVRVVISVVILCSSVLRTSATKSGLDLDAQYSFTDVFTRITAGVGQATPAPEIQEKLHIIGAGLSRTGTTSVGLALEHLGYKVYDITTAVPLRHLDLIKHAFEEKEDGVEVLQREILRNGFNATLDAPVAMLWEELLAAQPDAKVLLTVRDSGEQWFESYERHYDLFAPSLGLPFSLLVDFSFFHLFEKRYDCQDVWHFWTPWYFPWIKYVYQVDRNKAHCLQGRSKWIEDVKRKVPRDQLLVFNVKQGWEPLCMFLNKPVPEIPFPYVNTKTDVAIGYYVIRIIALLYPFLAAAPIGLLYWFCKCTCRRSKKEMKAKVE